jgi:hypothetical protein
MVLPTIKESAFVLSDAIITKLERPNIWVKFVPDYGRKMDGNKWGNICNWFLGVDLSVGLPELSITGSTVSVSIGISQ